MSGLRSTWRAIGAVVTLGLAAAAAACVPVPPPDAESAADCSLASTGGQLLEQSMPDGRRYLVYVPSGLEGREAQGVPLLVSLHGLNSYAEQMATYTGWQTDAEERGYIVVYPDSTDGSWEIADDSADVAYVRAVIADVASTRCVDAGRVHATGHSLGAYMAQRLACDASDVIASVTEYAGGPTTLGGFGCELDRPVAVGLFHGDRDVWVWPALGEQSRDQWVERNGCDPTAVNVPVADGTYQRYEPCAGGVVVTWRSYPGQRHWWPTGVRQEEMLDRMWELFDAHTL